MIRFGLISCLSLILAALAICPETVHATIYTVTNNLPSGPGSLPNTIAVANAKAGADTIQFNIFDPAQRPVTINATGMIITDELLIDGYSQAGAVQNTNNASLPFIGVLKIELSGAGLGGADPLVDVRAANTELRGLAFTGSEGGPAVRLGGAGGHSITGCLVGLKANGTYDEDVRNQLEGVLTESDQNTIGGTDSAHRNVISTNTGKQVYLQSNANTVRGNIVGLLPNGVDQPVETLYGVWAQGDDNLIGGAVGGARNIISGNWTGVFAQGNDIIIRRNRIGTDASGTLARGNRAVGILVHTTSVGTVIGGRVQGGDNIICGGSLGISCQGTGTIIRRNKIGVGVGGVPLGNTTFGISLSAGAADVQIGGELANDGNTIAHSGAAGISNTESTTQITIRHNSIYASAVGIDPWATGLGIDLGLYGVVPNDEPDADGFQNHPVLLEVDTSSGTGVDVSGLLNSVVDPPYVIEFFANPSCDSSGYGEGEIYLGDVTTSSSSFQAALPASVPYGYFMSATATNASGNTSEFGACVEILDPASTKVINAYESGFGSLRSAIEIANATAGKDTIRFDIPGPGPHVITVGSALPSLTESVCIDGTSQPGWSPNTITDTPGFDAVLPVTLAGELGSHPVFGLDVNISWSQIKGLHITAFGTAIDLDGGVPGFAGSGTAVEGCLLEGNSWGVRVGPSNVIGGSNAASRNSIRDNGVEGIRINGNDNVVEGNSIGASDTGNQAAANVVGIRINGVNNIILGTAASNFIVGNGIGIEIRAASNHVLGNNIGWPGVGNSGPGIVVDSHFNLIGGIGPNEANSIRWNDGDGVRVDAGVGSQIRGNAINDNGELGIDLGGDDVTFNDGLDIDMGPNGLTNFPLIVSAQSTPCELRVEGQVQASGFSDYTVDLYANQACDPSSLGEGEQYLGSTDVTTDGLGFAAFVISAPPGNWEGSIVTTTATGTQGTSEFSSCFLVTDPMLVVEESGSGLGTLAHAIEAANACPGMDTIRFGFGGAATLIPSEELPEITDPVVIDGYSQLGSSANSNPDDQGFNGDLRVTIQGQPSMDGLTVRTTGCTIRGLEVRDFNRGIHLVFPAGSSDITGQHFVTGSILRGNAVGIESTSSSNQIGGPEPEHRNVFRDNGIGLILDANLAQVVGNLFGTLDGVTVLPNTTAIVVNGNYNSIDGTESRNVIAASIEDGILAQNGANRLAIRNNFIGTGPDGVTPMGNGEDGIELRSATNARIGGVGFENVIMHNGLNGVSLISGYARVAANVIDANGGLGIDLNADGVTPNLSGDGWSDYPVLTSARSDGILTLIQGDVLADAPSSQVQLDFYVNGGCDASGHGEGQQYLGSMTVSVGQGLSEQFAVTFPAATTDGWISATATVGFDTSEFSQCLLVGSSATPTPALASPLLLHPNVPNPFNPSAQLSFDLPRQGVVRLAIYNVRGHRTRVLIDETLPAGRHELRWNGRDDAGRPVSSGVYLARLEHDGEARVRRMVLLK